MPKTTKKGGAKKPSSKRTTKPVRKGYGKRPK